MKVLIVHAHPEPRSFCASMTRAAQTEFERQGHLVLTSDLYAMNFDPVAKAADFSSRENVDYLVYALEQRHGVDTATISPDVAIELEKLLWSDLLVLTFPIFWFSVPAILKGWIDRVLVSGIVYGGRRFYDRGGLKGKRALVAATLGGRNEMFGAEGVHGELEAMLRHLLQGTLGYTGLRVLPPFFAYHVPYISSAERDAIMTAFVDRLAKLDADVPLPMPSLEDFGLTGPIGSDHPRRR